MTEKIDIPSCGICFQELASELCALMCGHVLHLSCLNNYMEFNNEKKTEAFCPFCRIKIGSGSNLENKICLTYELKRSHQPIGHKDKTKTISLLNMEIISKDRELDKLKKENNSLSIEFKKTSLLYLHYFNFFKMYRGTKLQDNNKVKDLNETIHNLKLSLEKSKQEKLYYINKFCHQDLEIKELKQNQLIEEKLKDVKKGNSNYEEILKLTDYTMFNHSYEDQNRYLIKLVDSLVERLKQKEENQFKTVDLNKEKQFSKPNSNQIVEKSIFTRKFNSNNIIDITDEKENIYLEEDYYSSKIQVNENSCQVFDLEDEKSNLSALKTPIILDNETTTFLIDSVNYSQNTSKKFSQNIDDSGIRNTEIKKNQKLNFDKKFLGQKTSRKNNYNQTTVKKYVI